jgi:hypothetical protein
MAPSLHSFELVLVNPHENIVSVYGICTDAPDGNLRIVMRLCVKSVRDLLQQHRPRVSHPHWSHSLLGRFTRSIHRVLPRTLVPALWV